ncbi:MAG TPA: hypothetical protein VMT85_09845 [Thermoanaerobaculia bacterium]|nr:hypothetical protein [Thermoanaerobaculia bacterium]
MSFEVKGSSIRSKLEFVEERFGADAEQALIAAVGKTELVRVLEPSWYPYPHPLYVALLRAIADRHFGGDLSSLQEVGGDTARRALDTTYRAFRAGTYADFLSRLSRLHHMLYSEGRSEVVLGEDGTSCRVVLSDKPRFDVEDLQIALGFYLECGRIYGCHAMRGRFEVAGAEARFDLQWNERRSRRRLPTLPGSGGR